MIDSFRRHFLPVWLVMKSSSLLGRLGSKAQSFWRNYRFRLSANPTKLKSLHNKYAGHRCFIIGTGPSLNSTNVGSLSSEYTFAVKSYLFTGIARFGFVPSFFCWSDRGTLLSSLPLFPAAMPDGMLCFLPFALRRQIRNCLSRNLSDIFLIHDIYEWNVHRGLFAIDPERELHCSGSVIIDYCIPLAIYMGFNPIYLVGCDHSLDNGKRHYDGSTSSLSGFSTPWEVLDQAFEVVQAYATTHGVEIFNATVGGNLNVFPRVNLLDVL